MQNSERRVSSTIARQSRNGQPVYVKKYVTGDWGANTDVVQARTGREVALVTRLHASRLFSGRLGVMQIIESGSDDATLVTREISGLPLSEFVRSQFRRPDHRCLSAMFLAGRWLKRFQEIELYDTDRKPISPLDPLDLVEYCRLRLDSLKELDYSWANDRVHGPLLRSVSALVGSSSVADQRLVWAHADYAPGNIIWDGRNLTLIDFAMAHADRPLLDVTYLIHRLEMQRIYRPWKRWPIAAWKRAILRGYGRPDAEESPMYQALMIRHLICRLHTYVRRPPRNLKQRLHDKWVRRCVQAKLMKALNDSPP